MRRDFAGMRARAALVMLHAESAQRCHDRGDNLGAVYQSVIAAENATVAEIYARRAYGLPVTQQHAALREIGAARRLATRAIH